METASIWPAVSALIGTIVGAAASIITTVLANKSAHHMQERSDAQDRAERARAFQRETLLEVQETIQGALRLMARIYFEDQKTASTSGSWGSELLPTELNEEFAQANRNLVIKIQRVADDSVRDELIRLHKTIGGIALVRSQAEAEEVMRTATTIANEVLPIVGKSLREMY